MIKKGSEVMPKAHEGQSMVTIDDSTGTITIDLVAYGPVRIVMTADGDIEVEGRSILNTAHWSGTTTDFPKRAEQ
ncbi:hypothetical protein [Labrys neptuniae]